MSRLVLGTASFGQPYGIKNDGVPSVKELERIAQIAWEGGIRLVHFSWQYNLPYEFDSIFKDFQRISKIESKPDWFKWNWKLGICVYKPEDIPDPLCGIFDAQYEMIQFPLNILDHRFLNYGWLKMLKSYKIETFARSVFLQGLLLMSDEIEIGISPLIYLGISNWEYKSNLPEWTQGEARKKIEEFHYTCQIHDLYPYEAALGWVLGLEEIDYVIVGVNNLEQLKQLLDVKPLKWDYDFSIQDEKILNPNNWPKKLPDIEFLRKYNSINYG